MLGQVVEVMTGWVGVASLCCAAGIFAVLKVLSENIPREPIAGKHVFITGGSSGIGLSTAKLVASRGAHVTIIARDKSKLAKAKEEIEAVASKSEGVQVVAESADVSNADQLKAAFDSAVAKMGGKTVDILVACAGFARPGYIDEIPEESFSFMTDVNFLGVINAVRCAVPGMKASRNGRIMLVSSLGGLVGVTGYSGYTPTKYAVRGLANVLQMELKPYGIYTSLVCPPDVDTPQFEVENRYKPVECKEISADAGLFQPEQIAADIVDAMVNYKFFVNTGFDGWLLGLISSDLTTPAHSASRAFAEIFLAGPLRVVSLVYLWMYNRICDKHYQARISKKKD